MKLKFTPDMTLAQFAEIRVAVRERLRLLLDAGNLKSEGILRRAWNEMERAFVMAGAPLHAVASGSDPAERNEFLYDDLPDEITLSDATKKYLLEQAKLNGTSVTTIVEEMIEKAVAQEINF